MEKQNSLPFVLQSIKTEEKVVHIPLIYSSCNRTFNGQVCSYTPFGVTDHQPKYHNFKCIKQIPTVRFMVIFIGGSPLLLLVLNAC